MLYPGFLEGPTLEGSVNRVLYRTYNEQLHIQ